MLTHEIPSSCWFILSSQFPVLKRQKTASVSQVLTFHHSLRTAPLAGRGPAGPIKGKLHIGTNTWLELRWTTYLARQVTTGGPATTASDSFSYLFSLPWMQPRLPPTSRTLFLSLWGSRSSAAQLREEREFSRCTPLCCSQSPSLPWYCDELLPSSHLSLTQPQRIMRKSSISCSALCKCGH